MKLVLEKHAKHVRRCGHIIKLTDVPIGTKFFFILRDPLTRFVSAFYSRQREGLPRYYSPRNEMETGIFETFSTANELACALGNPESEHHSLALRTMRVIGHFNGYFHWMISKEYFLSRLDDVLMCCFTESLEEDFEKLRPLLGLPEDVCLPTDEYFAHRMPRGCDTNLSEEAQNVLREYYRGDFEFVALCKEMFPR